MTGIDAAHGRHIGIAPSILTADFGRLAEQIRDAEAGGADLFHLDIMDGQFVPQLSFGPSIVEAVRKATSLPIEVHMMVARPSEHFESFAQAGAQTLVFHLEADGKPHAHIEAIHRLGLLAGIAINPGTPVAAVASLLPTLDEVIVMLVHPGRGGQEMIVEHLDKVVQLRAITATLDRAVVLEVDGGVKTHNASACVAAGVDQFVAGSAVYNASETPQQALAGLRAALAAG
ncbi:MAG: ribulose-phosphate 3-epimerase [Chloroflexi bacterium]|nr:MAG: ribulose-phosphate 3-epimerase [Chloroflexota bacterium]